MAILECRLVFFSYEYDGGGFGSEERSQAGLLEVIDVLIFARRQILEGRLITHVCIKGTINSSCPVVVVHSLVHRCSSQPQSFVRTSRLVLRSKMFSKLCTLALVAPLASALILQIPENPTSGGEITIKWTNEPNDPETWTFELINTAFNNAFAIANNVNPSASSLTLTIPIVPVGDGYTLQAVNIGDISQVYASTGTFAVGAATTSSNSGSSTSSVTVSVSSVTRSTAITSLTSTRPLSTTGSVSPTSITPSTTGTGTAATLIPSTAGALSSRLSLNAPAGGIAVAFLSAVAGAAMIAL